MRDWRWLAVLGVCLVAALVAGVAVISINRKPTVVQFNSGPTNLLRAGTLADPTLLLSANSREVWLAQAEQTLAIAHSHPQQIATLASLVAATGTTLTVQTLPISIPNQSSPHLYSSYSATSQRVTFTLPSSDRIHVTEARSLSALREGTPLFLGGTVATSPGGLRLAFVTDLGDLAHAAARNASQAQLETPRATVAVVPVSAKAGAAYRLVADVTSSSTNTPPAGSVLFKNQFGAPGIDWTGGIQLGDTNGCPYLKAGIEFKAGAGFEWNWPMALRLDSHNTLSVAGIDQPTGAPFTLGLSDPGADQSYYLGLGVAAGLSITVGCHFGPVGGDFTLADISFKAMLANETTKHAPLTGESDLSISPTDCLTLYEAPLNSIPSWVPFAGQLKEFAEFALSGCADLRLSGGSFQALVHGTGPAVNAPPLAVTMTSSKGALIPAKLTSGNAITVDNVSYQPLLHIGIIGKVELGSNAQAAQTLGDKLQSTLSGSSTSSSSTLDSVVKACKALKVPQLQLSCTIAALTFSAQWPIDWPHPLEMVSRTILGQPVSLVPAALVTNPALLPTLGPYATRAAAEAFVVQSLQQLQTERGQPPELWVGVNNPDRVWGEGMTLHVVSGYVGGEGQHPTYLFFFVNGNRVGEYVTNVEALSRIDSSTVAVGYRVYNPGDANCCATGGTATVRFKWDGSNLILLDPLQGSEPPRPVPS